MMENDGPWSLGVLVGLPIALVVGLVIVAAIWFLISEARSQGDRTAGAWAIGMTLVLVGYVGFLISPLVYWPLDAEYHQWRGVEGTVSQIDKRLIGSGDKMEDKFVVRFDGSSQQYGCDDTRCAQVREGDTLALSCKRAWQYTGTDGYDCRFVETIEASDG